MTDSPIKERAYRRKFGIVGVIFGCIAFGTALFHYWAGPFTTAPSPEETVAEKTIRIKDKVVLKIKRDKTVKTPPERVYLKDDIINITTISLGFIAIVSAIVSFIQREDKRVSFCAALLGAVAIGLQLLNIALGILCLAIIIAAVFGSLGFS